MEIKKPSEAQFEEILQRSPQALYEGTRGNARPSDEKVKQLIYPLLEKGGYYLAATEGETLMGWVLLGPAKDHFTDAEYGFLYELYVIEEFRGRGLSKHLMKEAIEQLKQKGYPEIRLGVFAGNPAAQLYEQLGFTVRNMVMSLPL
ncbi:GNAT family N-acetyltransferase [Brevibacillus ruminantium]|uniref:GNAT family N-acetyltransferase n=1 Tax=Brevibacillus ruminantium TaxID=2950604 RepID=A0ABY4WMH9_9BACL|nr:GNAT family N-acetyltransferase [Brevibacillus ruminantium]USG67328.1 GNAT family N-acetyltransferase [Brevibacillus ruminantium]